MWKEETEAIWGRLIEKIKEKMITKKLKRMREGRDNGMESAERKRKK